jgi:hypothetical protein
MKIGAVIGILYLKALSKILPTSSAYLLGLGWSTLYNLLKKIVFYCELHENWPIDVRTVLKCANEFLLAISLFLQRHK